MDSNQLIDDIYEAALMPGRWQQILDKMAASTNALGTMLHSTAFADPGHRFLASAALDYFMSRSAEWARANSRGRLLVTLPANEFHSDADYYSLEEMQADWLYRDFLWPHGIGYAAATHIRVPNGDTLILSVERPLAKGPFSRDEVNYLTALRPHLARSAMLASRLEFERIHSANHAMQMTGLPSAAIGADGRVLDCNALFSNLSSQIVITAKDRLRLSHPKADNVLTEFLQQSGQAGLETALASRSVAIPRSSTAIASVLHFVPVIGDARDLFSHARFFLIATPLERKLVTVDLIQGLFDLTVAEARVASAVASGRSVGEIAAEFDILPDTVRHHLKSIYSKTGFARQADLASTIAGIRTL